MSELKRKKRTVVRVMLFAVLLVIGIGAAGYNYYNSQLKPVNSGDNTYREIIIPENSTAGQVAGILKQSNLIQNEKVFLFYCRQASVDGSLKAGRYKMSKSQSVQEIVNTIIKGSVVNICFTIPEGYTVEKIGAHLVEHGICSGEEWQEALEADYTKYNFLDKSAAADGKSYLEGYLFPDTYIINDDTSCQEIVDLMLSTFDQFWQYEFAEQAQEKGISINEAIIIASLIEREAMVPEERKTVSGVIQNRLDIGMPLQIDATVLYALGDNDKDTVYNRDLEVDSPYNTYKCCGLPPAPIANPGRASIQAAINPEKHDYYYYVARGDGSHQFTRTYEEHLQAQARYQ